MRSAIVIDIDISQLSISSEQSEPVEKSAGNVLKSEGEIEKHFAAHLDGNLISEAF